MHTVHPIPIYHDNYVWALVADQKAVIVDPGDAKPVQEWLENKRITPIAIIVTHGHWDHVTGIESLVETYQLPVYGPAGSPIPCLTHPVDHGDTVDLLGAPFNVLRTPGHTADHICYHSETLKTLFCGDVLFSAGCGRINERMDNAFQSLQRLGALPPDTQVYCTHEYTLANTKFALAAEPSNEQLVDYKAECEQKRRQGKPTLPTTIALERKINPFIRTHEVSIVENLTKKFNKRFDTEEDIFTALREWKNHF